MDKRHTAENLAEQLHNIFHEWNISEKVLAVVTDNAKNIVNSIPLISSTNEKQIFNIKCAAHTLQLAVNHAMKIECISDIINQCNKVVGHFKHSALAVQSLEKRQEQSGLSKTILLQSCKTLWNSVYLMLERLYLNRCAIFNVLTDKNITNRSLAEKLEIKETEWTLIDSLIKVLKPIHMTTTVLCTEKHSPISMIRKKIIEKHLLHTDDKVTVIQSFKKTIVLELERRFFLDLSPTEQILPEQIASFLDPRYKYLEHEALSTREEIRSRVK
ncbi:unnamed protein product [Macrosiphum euphorbiae]|nr:unnamed protein product [Macrosiphum euphorbiae]